MKTHPSDGWEQVQTAHPSLIRVEGDGTVSDCALQDQPFHRDCNTEMFAACGPVHSAFFNLDGERYLGRPNGKEDIVVPPKTLAVIHGRLAHCGRGRSAQQGTHVVLHCFVMHPAPGSPWASMAQDQRDRLLLQKPELVQLRKPPGIGYALADCLSWPSDCKYETCLKCGMRRPHFRCTKPGCKGEYCLACRSEEQLCEGCIGKRSSKKRRPNA